MDKLTVIKILDLIHNHIIELQKLPGNPIGRDQTVEELKLLSKELKEKIK